MDCAEDALVLQAIHKALFVRMSFCDNFCTCDPIYNVSFFAIQADNDGEIMSKRSADLHKQRRLGLLLMW